MKNILKEISLFVLIIAAIILVLGVLLYDYIPTSKVVPTTISYQTPENLKAEIEETVQEDSAQVIVSYEIDGTDLNKYQEMSSYVPGKQNPFGESAAITDIPTDTSSGTATSGNSSGATYTVPDEEFFNNNKTK